MPTLFRFLLVLIVIGGLGFAAIFAFATYIQPESREMSVTVPNNRLDPR